jgi:3-oxoacyl-[acyl-carrier protein] reductase
MNQEENSRLAVVSGAAKGIGKACVDVFVKQGWRVVALDLDENVRSVFAAESLVTSVVVNVTDNNALAGELKKIKRTPVHALVNAAGIFPPTSLSTFEVEEYRRIFDVNVLGTLLLSKLASQDMPRGGAIVNCASINAFIPRADQIIYAATKAATVSITRSMAADLAERRIRVNAVAPGPVETDGLRNIPGRLDEAARQVPLGRVQSPVEVAELVFWLVDGEGAQFITGETVVCSGGLYMR